MQQQYLMLGVVPYSIGEFPCKNSFSQNTPALLCMTVKLFSFQWNILVILC